MSAPRVLLLTSSPVDGHAGGDGELAAALVRCLPDVEFAWFGCTPARGGTRVPGGRRLPVLTRDGEPRRGTLLQVAGWTAALGRGFDLVHAVVTIGPHYAALSHMRRLLAGRRPVLHTVPGVMRHEQAVGGGAFGDVTVTLSEATADGLREAGFGDVRVVPPTVDPARWPRVPRTAQVDGQAPLVLYAGHHDALGGAREAVTAAAVAQRRGVRLRLALAVRERRGQDAAALAADLASYARGQGLDRAEVFGHVEDMAALVREADAVVYTPHSLGGKADVPLVVLEAMATGRPVVLGSLPQFAALGDAVARVPAGDGFEAGAALARLLGDTGTWEEYAQAGWRTARTRFGPHAFAARYAELYGEMLSDGHAAGGRPSLRRSGRRVP